MNAHARHVTAARAETPQSMAQRFYDEARGDEEKAIERLANMVEAYASMRRDFILIAARQLVGGVRRQDNAKIISTGTPFQPNHDGHRRAQERASLVGSIVSKSLFDLRFKFDGTIVILGDSTPEDLQPVAAHYLGQGATMLRTGRWLERVIAATPSGKRVRDALRIKELQRLKKESEQIPV